MKRRNALTKVCAPMEALKSRNNTAWACILVASVKGQSFVVYVRGLVIQDGHSLPVCYHLSQAHVGDRYHELPKNTRKEPRVGGEFSTVYFTWVSFFSLLTT